MNLEPTDGFTESILTSKLCVWIHDGYVVHDLDLQALRLDMSSVLKDQSLLYPFIQFLKGEGCVNILQFCLDVGKIFFACGHFHFPVTYLEDGFCVNIDS
jgi:hypothetical protein